jgi:hypothetical protein
VEFWLTGGAVALITSLASSKGKRVGDFLAGTVVVRERMPTRAAPVAMMPPQLAGWASTLDLARVPDDLALAARQFLGRFRDLAPEVRESMGGRLAAAMAAVTSPPPPPGVPAWAFLSAVLAERRRREMARMLPPPGYHPMSPYGGHHPEAQGHLAEGPPPGERLERHGVADDDGDIEHQHQGGTERVVDLQGHAEDDEGPDDQQEQLHGEVQCESQRPARQLGQPHLEHDGLADHELAHATPPPLDRSTAGASVLGG